MNCSNQLIIVVIICFMASCGTQAVFASASPGLYQGTFTGTAIGNCDSSAPLILNLTQKGNVVTGTATIGNGIEVNTGNSVCPGLVPVPSGTINFNGKVSRKDPRHLEARSDVSILGMTITSDVVTKLSLDNDTMNIQLNLNIPWPCESSTLKATLIRCKQTKNN